jgi:hypothetical protein
MAQAVKSRNFPTNRVLPEDCQNEACSSVEECAVEIGRNVSAAN